MYLFFILFSLIQSCFGRHYTVQELRCEVCKSLVTELEAIIGKVGTTALAKVGSYRLDEKGNPKTVDIPLVRSETFLVEALESACDQMQEYARGYDKKTKKLRVVRIRTGDQLSPDISEVHAISDSDLNESLKFHCEDIADMFESGLSLTSGVLNAEPEIECSQGYLNFCLSLLPKMVDQSVLKRMPTSEKEIVSLCHGFSTEMECFNRYARKCLVPRERQLIEIHSSGAKNIYKYLCNDNAFRTEYLKHTRCFKGTQSDWESCVSRFVQLFKDEIESQNMTHETRVLHTCCAIHGFSRCVFVPGTMKCEKDDALFLLKLTEISIDRQEYYRECRTITNYTICLGCTLQISCILLTTGYFILLINN